MKYAHKDRFKYKGGDAHPLVRAQRRADAKPVTKAKAPKKASTRKDWA